MPIAYREMDFSGVVLRPGNTRTPERIAGISNLDFHTQRFSG